MDAYPMKNGLIQSWNSPKESLIVDESFCEKTEPVKKPKRCGIFAKTIISHIFKSLYFTAVILQLLLVAKFVIVLCSSEPVSLHDRLDTQPLGDVDINQPFLKIAALLNDKDGAFCEEALGISVRSSVPLLMDSCITHLNQTMNETNIMKRMRLAVQYNLSDFRYSILHWGVKHSAEVLKFYATDEISADAESDVRHDFVMKLLLLLMFMIFPFLCLWPGFSRYRPTDPRGTLWRCVFSAHLFMTLIICLVWLAGPDPVVALLNRHFARLYQPRANYGRFVGPFSYYHADGSAFETARADFENLMSAAPQFW